MATHRPTSHRVASNEMSRVTRADTGAGGQDAAGRDGSTPDPVRYRTTRAPTMRDIATACGVSQSTVSRILSGAPTAVPILPQTRARVLDVARQLNYRPNPLARGLRGARTMLLGVIVREIMDPFFAGAIDAITAEASSRGYNVVLGHAHGRVDEAVALRGVLETRHCDAIIFVGDLRDRPGLQAELAGAQSSVVGMWLGSGLPDVSTVNVDNRVGVRALVDHLVGLGHASFGFIGGGHRADSTDSERPLGDTRARRGAFVERLAELGLSASMDICCEVPNTYAGGAQAFEDIRDNWPLPTAIVASTDVLAIGALHAARRLGIRVPDQMSIVGFDDLPISEFTGPPLTTVRNPVAEMATVAVRAAIDGIADPSLCVESVLAPSLVVRESTGPAPRPH